MNMFIKNAAQNLRWLLFLPAMLVLSQVAGAQTILDAAKTEAMIKKDPNVQLIDLRSKTELQQTGWIPGAKHINFFGATYEADIKKLDKQKPIIVYCASGGRSGEAAAQLVQLGFKKVYDYSGGMYDWRAKGKKTTK